MRVAVIGGGISGLCTAFRLKRAGVRVTLFEAGAAVGGNIQTVTIDGFLLEHGPNSLLANREVFDLIEDLHISEKIVLPGLNAKNRFIVRGGKLAALPSRLLDVFTTRAFSVGGRLRLLKEPFVRTRSSEGESIRGFFERRLGKEIAEYAVDPFVSGIYAGDPAKLSVKDAFPRIYELEHNAGSIFKGAVFSPKANNPKLQKGLPRSFTFKNGMSTLPKALEENLGGTVTLGTPVTAIAGSADNSYRISTTNLGEESYDAIVISTPAQAAARLIASLDNALAAELANIYYPPLAVVFAAYAREQVKVIPDGFGVLVPAAEKRRILGCLFSSSSFEGRAPAGFHLFTVFIGGSRNAELCRNSEESLIGTALEDIASLLDIDGGPAFTSIKKWERSIPQYNIGYGKVSAAVDEFRASNPGIFFCSNFYKGISVGDCVKNSVLTAKDVLAFLDR